jgi:uncharacterized protein (PEP-CTERM system associated)
VSPTVIYDQRLSLSTTASASVAFIGVRHSVALSVFHGKLQDVPGSVGLLTGTSLNNNVQTGVGLALSDRLSPTMTLSGELARSVLRSLASSSSNETSEQRTATISLQRELSPRSSLRLGARYTQLIQNDVVQREAAVLVGLAHRF